MIGSKNFLLLFTIILQSFFVIAQNECKVLVPDLQGTYNGKCKKGLANGHGVAVGKDSYEGNFRKGYPHGEGVYKWSTGEVYDGRWKMGLKDGEGVYTFQSNGHDTIQDGIWKDDEYKGKKPQPPKVVQKEGVTRYNFRKESSEGNSIFFYIKSSGTVNRDLEELSVVSSSGSLYTNTNSIGLETVAFPVIVKITYRAWNAMHTSRHDVKFEFEIIEEGKWSVDIFNN